VDKFPGVITEKGIETHDYSWFKFDDLNRLLGQEALADLKDDFNEDTKENEYPFQAPIVVYWVRGMTEGVIQQGHHRFTVCKDSNLQIRYTVTDSYRPSSRGQENQHQDWTTDELVQSYAKEGLEPYFVLQKLKNEHPTYSLVVLSAFINGSAVSTQALRNRSFKLELGLADESYGRAKQRIIKFEQFNKVSQRTDRPKETVKMLVKAMERQDFDWKYFIERAEANCHEARLKPEFKSISTSARAIAMIQFYYNHNSRKNFFF
jgi:hypothetical protein